MGGSRLREAVAHGGSTVYFIVLNIPLLTVTAAKEVGFCF